MAWRTIEDGMDLVRAIEECNEGLMSKQAVLQFINDYEAGLPPEERGTDPERGPMIDHHSYRDAARRALELLP